MPSSFQRDRFTWLIYLMLTFYGYILNVFGPITPFLKDELNISYTVSSLHTTAFAVGILLVGLGGHLVIERAGRQRSLWIGAMGLSLGTVLLLVGRSPVATIGASFIMGLVGSLILAIVPSALADRHGEQRSIAISEANTVGSLVATLAPLMVGWFAGVPGGWRVSLAIIASTPVVLALAFGKVRFPPAGRLVDADGKTDRTLPGKFWAFWAALVLAVSVEFCMVIWSADYLEKALGMPKVSAAQAVSLFLGGMILGRLAGSRLVLRFTTLAVVSFSIILAGAGFLVFWLGGNPLISQAGLFVTGLGVASLYPLILSMALGAAQGKTVQASARASLASGSAILALPLILGRIADATGIRPAYGLVLFLLIALFALLRFTQRLSGVRQPAASN